MTVLFFYSEVFTLDASINTAANDDDAWATVLNTVDNAFSDKSRIKKKVIKKEVSTEFFLCSTLDNVAQHHESLIYYIKYF